MSESKKENEQQSADDVLQMLDSIDKDATEKKKSSRSKKHDKQQQQQKQKQKDEEEPKEQEDQNKDQKPKKSSDKAARENDIMGFLDDLSKTNSGRSTPRLDSKEFENSDENVKDKGKQKVAEAEEEAVPQETAAQETSSTPRPDPIGTMAGWWASSGLWDTASNVVKQAEERVKDLSHQDAKEAQNKIESFGKKFTDGFLKSVLDTIAPPISQHEQLKIHIFHDMVGYPAVDKVVYNVFDRVMQQVEGGGDLTMIVQKGKERHRRGSDRDSQRDFNMFKGSVDQGKKLAAANIEEYIKAQKKAKDSTEQPAAAAAGSESEQKVRTSDIFLSIQPTANEGNKEDSNHYAPTSDSNSFYFVIYLSDPEHDIAFSTISQPYPAQWADWLDSNDNEFFKSFDADPRDWVIDWIEEGLGLAVGTLAQSYVIKRMGVDTLFKRS